MGFRRWWKKLKGWRKGGIIGILINTIIGYMSITGWGNIISPQFGYISSWFYFALPNEIYGLIINCSGYKCIENMFLTYIIWIPIAGFIVGALIGHIYTKIMKKQ